MEMVIDFPGGSRVDAHFGPFTVKTDQPPEASAPTPFATFLASIGTCAGIYVLGFCRQRNIPADDVRLIERFDVDRSTGMVKRVMLDIEVPPDFPEKYKAALVRSAEHCAVKEHFEHPPEFEITTVTGEAIPA